MSFFVANNLHSALTADQDGGFRYHQHVLFGGPDATSPRNESWPAALSAHDANGLARPTL
jgi:hypothetical protein